MKIYLPYLLLVVLAAGPFTKNLSAQSVNWYHDSKTKDAPYNIGTNDVYSKLLNNKAGIPVIVAVIDSGVDIEHEDLKDVIWVNTDEIPDNDKDDDQNGYVDDINGWNFIGGPNGDHVDGDTYEMTRLYAALRSKYNDKDPSTLDKKQIEEYNQFNTWGKKIEKEIKSAKTMYSEFEAQAFFYEPILDHMDGLSEERELSTDLADSLTRSFIQEDVVCGNIINYYHKEAGYIPSSSEIREHILGPVYQSMDHYGAKFKYNFNPDYDSRIIIGDNYDDPTEKYYGNNLVEGPDAFHGTHVAGIIAASRGNEKGIEGIASNVKIMPIRAVPDGDERDKDVANAIYYAVENGASIINMSFGKGHSPHKEIVDDAIRFAEKKDVLIVHAAGNSGLNLDDSDNFPNDHFIKPKGFLFWKKKQPKNYLSVGACAPAKNEDIAASFSNYGKKDVDLFAPGVMMLSTTPDNNYEIAQGTSMAAPVISGVAAILRSYFPTLTAKQIKEILVDTSSPLTFDVKKPGADEIVPFSELSVSGGIVDIKQAVLRASRTKGKRKLKKDKKVRA